MNTLFEIKVVGDDLENLTAAAEAALDEVERVERLLSRFNPTSETSRLNREAAIRPVQIDFEMLQILQVCREYWEKTEGHFDLTAGIARRDLALATGSQNFSAVQIDVEARTVQFTEKGVRLDFGAFGKGYALDCAAKLMSEFGVQQALLHGGTSSIFALGSAEDEEAWRVGLRHPWSKNVTEEFRQLRLTQQGLSSSAVFDEKRTESDIINPHGHLPLNEQAGCVVIAPTATEAEILSTAFLSMGKTSAALCCQKFQKPGFQVGWIEHSDAAPTVAWLTPAL